MLDRYERDDGFSSDFVTGLGVIAAVSLLTLAVWEIWHPQPAVNVRLLRSRAFAISCAVMFLFGVLLISSTQLLPQLAQTLLNYDARTAGLTLGVGGLATLVLMPLAGVVTGRLVQPKWLILMALAGTGWALYAGAQLDLGIGFWNLSMLRMMQAVWLPFVFIPLSAVCYVGVPPDRNNEASALINLMRNLGGSVGVSFTTTMLQERLQFHHARLADTSPPTTAMAGTRRWRRSTPCSRRRLGS